MSHVWTIAKKELRGFFGSPVALLFLGGFLAFTLLGFFWYEKFFARNVADLRPLFELLPLAMIVLVGALAMRLWAEEQRSGTIEMLLTLPIARHQLVLGKFVAGMLLIALALAMTLGVPATVALLGDLDWGPVIGGYVAALMLAAAYLAIGMCISATTDNQIVALIGTTLVCVLLYVPGTEAVTQLVGLDAAGWLRSLATGARFESIARGMLDVRDLAYYASLTVAFLALNVYMLVRRGFGGGKGDERVRQAARLALALVLVNALLLNIWLAPVTSARADLTARQDFSLSATTRRVVAGLREPVLVRAYFSDNLPVELKAYVPRITDILGEYAIVGDGKIRLEQLDPNRSKALAERAKAEFGLEPTPFRELTKNKDALVNAYFYVVLKQGNRSAVLDVGDFLEEKIIENRLTFRLKSVEYTVTGMIKKLAATGEDLGARIKALPTPVTITAYLTPDNLPPQLAKLPESLDLAARQLRQEMGDNLVYQLVTPPAGTDPDAFFATHQVTPSYKNLATQQAGYFTVKVTSNGRTQPLVLDGSPDFDSIKGGLRSAIRRSVPGFAKVVGIWSPPPPPPPMAAPGVPAPNAPQLPPPQVFEGFARGLLQSDYDLAAIRVFSPQTLQLVDVLVLAGPSGLSTYDAEAIDQYVMRGGALVVLAGRFRLAMVENDRLRVERVNTGLEDMFRAWGIDVAPYLVLDEVSDQFPAPVDGGKMELKPYPYFVRLDGEAMNDAHPATADVAWSVMQYVSPIVDARTNGPLPARINNVAITPLLRSSARAWTDTNVDVHPDRALAATRGNAALTLAAPYVLGVTLTGSLPSFAAQQATARGASAQGLVTASPANTQVVVLGSSAFASDELVELLTQLGNQSGANNLLFLQNLVDWAVSDHDMLAIRSQSTHTPLLNVTPERAAFWEYVNYGLGAAALVVMLLAMWIYQRTRRPWPVASWKAATTPGEKEAA